MKELIDIISNYGIGIACVGYLIYFQSTTMQQMLKTLGSINERLVIIEEKLESRSKSKSQKVKE